MNTRFSPYSTDLTVDSEILSEFISIVVKHAKNGSLDSYGTKGGVLQIWIKNTGMEGKPILMWVDGEWID